MVPGVPVTLEGVHRCKDGSVFRAEVRVGLIEWDGRQHQFALVRNVTARKRFEQALQQYSEKLQELVDERTAQLRESEERQRALLEINNAIISVLETAGWRVSGERGAARLLGMKPTTLEARMKKTRNRKEGMKIPNIS